MLDWQLGQPSPPIMLTAFRKDSLKLHTYTNLFISPDSRLWRYAVPDSSWSFDQLHAAVLGSVAIKCCRMAAAGFIS